MKIAAVENDGGSRSLVNDLDFYWKQIIELKKGERVGNLRGTVFHYGDYMLLETKEGAKRTTCLDSARYLAGVYEFDRVEELFN